MLPYGWTRWGIAQLNQQERRPAVFYLHPWEIDPDQPRLQTSMLGRMRHYGRLEQTEQRLQRLLSEFSFGPLSSTFVADTPVSSVAAAGGSFALPYQW